MYVKAEETLRTTVLGITQPRYCHYRDKLSVGSELVNISHKICIRYALKDLFQDVNSFSLEVNTEAWIVFVSFIYLFIFSTPWVIYNTNVP